MIVRNIDLGEKHRESATRATTFSLKKSKFTSRQ